MARGIEPVKFEKLGRDIHLFDDLPVIWKLYRLMRRFRPDIVHTHTAKAGAVGSLWDVVRDRRLNHRPEVVSGVLAEESAALLADFFDGRR